MAYIGNTVQNQGFTPAIDYFNGNGVTVTFTLSRPVASVAQLIVAIDNVIQNPNTAFSVSGNSITFTSAPLSGTNNIWVEYTSLITTYAAISQDPSVIGDISATGGYLAEGDFGNTFIDGTIVDYVTGTARITTGPSDAIAFYNGGTNARNPLMTLASTGNVGIGTTSPSSKLQVNTGTGGNVVIGNSSNAANPRFIFEPIVGNAQKITVFGDVTDVERQIAFCTGASGTERMRIDSGGNLLVGTTTQYFSSQLTVQGGFSAAGIYTKAGTGGSGAAANLFNINWTGTPQLWIDTTNIGTFSFTSDYRIKRNIETQTAPALERVMALRPVTYQMADYGDLFKSGEEIKEGFIAHELQEVIPSGVDGAKDDPVQIQSLRMDAILAVAVKAIQELKATVDAQAARIAALEGATK
jgi:hypothetical protein